MLGSVASADIGDYVDGPSFLQESVSAESKGKEATFAMVLMTADSQLRKPQDFNNVPVNMWQHKLDLSSSSFSSSFFLYMLSGP